MANLASWTSTAKQTKCLVCYLSGSFSVTKETGHYGAPASLCGAILSQWLWRLQMMLAARHV